MVKVGNEREGEKHKKSCPPHRPYKTAQFHFIKVLVFPHGSNKRIQLTGKTVTSTLGGKEGGVDEDFPCSLMHN